MWLFVGPVGEFRPVLRHGMDWQSYAHSGFNGCMWQVRQTGEVTLRISEPGGETTQTSSYCATKQQSKTALFSLLPCIRRCTGGYDSMVARFWRLSVTRILCRCHVVGPNSYGPTFASTKHQTARGAIVVDLVMRGPFLERHTFQSRTVAVSGMHKAEP